MTDSEGKKEKDSHDSRTIIIEIPGKGLEGMFPTMTGRSDSNAAGSGCCGMMREKCGPRSEEEDRKEFRIVIKNKER